MRFIEGGPSIPDELLSARDEGRLVIFCGAGVSRAKAQMPDFISLAESVANSLGVLPDDPLRTVLSEIRTIRERTGVNGLISADVVFDQLEQSFERSDIEKAVAQVLKPSENVDLSAHRMLIDLARTPTGNVRIVTSNFELLFEECYPDLKVYSPLSLPDLNRVSDFNGIVHNHGLVNENYTDSAGEGFILSSSEFGKAYLAEGWATKFIRTILDKYVVLFVGYSADDPPVKYLLQGLNRLGNNKNTLYAFHPGTIGEADESWSTKGVEPIAYNPEDNHHYLWDSLGEWRDRAIDIDSWYEKKFSLADKGPENLSPHQRGQITHIVSTRAGAKKLAERETPIPASWLCVFDPNMRFSQPGYHRYDYSSDGEWIDPFELFGIDEDEEPKKIAPGENERRQIPNGARDVFYVLERELVGRAGNSVSHLRGYYSVKPSLLPERLFYVGAWIAKLAEQPELLWWAGRQKGLHPEIQDQIKNVIDKTELSIDPVLRAGWEYLFDVWENVKPQHDFEWYKLKDTVDKHGWSKAIVRRFSSILKPHYVSKHPFRNVIPPRKFSGNLNQLLSLEVSYPDHVDDLDVDSEYSRSVVKTLAVNLQLAVELDKEIGGYGQPIDYSVKSVVARGTMERSYYDMVILIDLLVLNFEKLVKSDAASAKSVLASWEFVSLDILTAIKIWALGQESLYSAKEVGKQLLHLSIDAFWCSSHQDDLLDVLARRWNELGDSCQCELQDKILEGPKPYEREESENSNSRRAWRILERLVWLVNNGCNFSFDVEKEKQRLIRYCPEWSDDNASDHTSRVKSGWVRTKTNHDQLVDIPLAQIIDTAKSSMGRGSDYFVENDPFKGLVEQRPIRAFSALVNNSKAEDYPVWAWQTFLNYELRKNDSPRLVIAIAHRILQLPPECVSNFIHSFSSWVDKWKQVLFSHSDTLFYQLFDLHIEVFKSDITTAGSAITGGTPEPDWLSKAINSPVGTLTSALLSDPSAQNLGPKSGFPKYWLSSIEQLINLDNNYGIYALVILARNMRWFYNIDQEWTKNNLLSQLNEPISGDAIWSGFLWSGNSPQTDLFLAIKQDFIKLIKSRKSIRRRETQALAAFLLAGWLREIEESSRRIISNDEMREILLEVDEDFRSQVIWMYERWLLGKNNETDLLLVKLASEFFTIVWPKHLKAKSAVVSAKLFDFAMSTLDKVDGVVDMVIPLMELNESARIRSSNFLNINDDSQVMKFPEDCLKLLYAILSEDAKNWPYGVDRALPKIIEANPSLKTDPMYIELKRRWDSR